MREFASPGEYHSDKLINVGNNRWAIKPELSLSHPIGPWYLEAYAGLWLFGDNDDFLSGQRRAQDPLASFPAVELARRHDILPADREKSVAQIQLERGRPTRVGSDFTAYGIAWQYTLID